MDEKRTVEAWAESKKTPKWVFAASRMLHAWVIGEEITEADYDKAVHDAANVKVGG